MMATASLLRTLAAVALVAAVVQANVPNGFVNEKLMDVQQAMSMAFLPDGRLLVGTCPLPLAPCPVPQACVPMPHPSAVPELFPLARRYT